MKPIKRHELPFIPTANLVDIAILLIIFYMACSNFVSQTAAKVTLPKAEALERQQEPLVLVLIDSMGNIYLQGKQLDNAAAVQSGVSALLQDKTTDAMRMVMFRCDESVNRDIFEPVISAIVEAGGIIMAVGENLGTGK
jgi:biopolymer transport protein ExbD